MVTVAVSARQALDQIVPFCVPSGVIRAFRQQKLRLQWREFQFVPGLCGGDCKQKDSKVGRGDLRSNWLIVIRELGSIGQCGIATDVLSGIESSGLTKHRSVCGVKMAACEFGWNQVTKFLRIWHFLQTKEEDDCSFGRQYGTMADLSFISRGKTWIPKDMSLFWRGIFFHCAVIRQLIGFWWMTMPVATEARSLIHSKIARGFELCSGLLVLRTSILLRTSGACSNAP